MTLVYISLFLVFLPWLVMLVILANRVLADLREQKRQGREMDPATRDFLRLCWVTLLVAQALGGW